MDKSGHGNNPTERGALTSWRAQTDGQVRTWKQSDRARGTHLLEDAGTNKSGHRNKPTERGALTNWRAQTDEQVRTEKQSDRVRSTHGLERADGRTSQDTDRIRPE